MNTFLFLFLFIIGAVLGFYSESRVTKLNVYLLEKYSIQIERSGKGTGIKEIKVIQRAYQEDLFVVKCASVIIKQIYYSRIATLLALLSFLFFGF